MFTSPVPIQVKREDVCICVWGCSEWGMPGKAPSRALLDQGFSEGPCSFPSPAHCLALLGAAKPVLTG